MFSQKNINKFINQKLIIVNDGAGPAHRKKKILLVGCRSYPSAIGQYIAALISKGFEIYYVNEESGKRIQIQLKETKQGKKNSQIDLDCDLMRFLPNTSRLSNDSQETNSEINRHLIVSKYNLKHHFHGHVHLRARLHSGPLSYCFGMAIVR